MARRTPQSDLLLLESMSDAVYAMDRNRRITHWNRAAERVTGFAAHEVGGRLCFEGVLGHVDDDGNPSGPLDLGRLPTRRRAAPSRLRRRAAPAAAG